MKNADGIDIQDHTLQYHLLTALRVCNGDPSLSRATVNNIAGAYIAMWLELAKRGIITWEAEGLPREVLGALKPSEAPGGKP